MCSDYHDIDEYWAQLEIDLEKIKQETCQHEWEEKVLLTSIYKKCKKCGLEQKD